MCASAIHVPIAARKCLCTCTFTCTRRPELRPRAYTAPLYHSPMPKCASVQKLPLTHTAASTVYTACIHVPGRTLRREQSANRQSAIGNRAIGLCVMRRPAILIWDNRTRIAPVSPYSHPRTLAHSHTHIDSPARSSSTRT